MATAFTALAPFDNRPFFDKALRYGVAQDIITPGRLQSLQEEFSKGIVQIAHFFGTAHLRPELELALHRMVNLVSLYLEDMSGGDMQIAAASLRDRTLLSHSKAGSDMLKRLHAMPDSTLIGRGPVSAEGQRAYLDQKTASDTIPLAEYRSELGLRQEMRNTIDFSLWLAKTMGVSRDDIDDAESLIRSAMLVVFVDQAELKLPTRTAFVRLFKSAKHPKARLNENRLKGFLREAPTEFQRLARGAMDRFIERDLPQIRAASSTADKLLYSDAGENYFISESVDDDVREYDRLVAREWDRVTQGEADDPTVVATVFLFVATGLPPKTTLLLREAKEVISIFRSRGFDSQAVIKFVDDHAPAAIREELQKFWNDELKPEAEEQLSDLDPNWPDAHMERALEYLRKTCRVTWKARRR
ncbi:hypothetical protein [Thiobacillus denitrificans]|uniref:Uncharacterized protein n=1 Tax=Thiobacillus denitrificans TaxID=36861 RepID=A0A106BKU5_THIDE|nr:hypothetical protein [Thiobacillus denitrificans]KVW94329.1 hypothetical protein ABW22_13180 [Thiobacillus denitrificans]